MQWEIPLSMWTWLRSWVALSDGYSVLEDPTASHMCLEP
jgi:hypothetical protein